MRSSDPNLSREILDGVRDQFKGMERLIVELGAIEIQAKDGKVDLSKVQLESVIV